MVPVIIENLRGDLRALREVLAPEQVTAAPDKPSGYRVSSAAFMPGTDGSISVDLEESLARAGLDVRARYPALPRAVALVAHRIDAIRAKAMSIDHAPISGNDHHGEIRANGFSRKALRDAARNLADHCEILEAINIAEVERQTQLKAEREAQKRSLKPDR